MVSAGQASEIIQSNLYDPKKETVHLEDAVGKVLAVKVFSDRDFPPFDRVAMDGLAIAYASWRNGQREFLIESVQAAGEPQKVLQDISHGIEIMTGAILPQGTDVIVRYEDLIIENGSATVNSSEIQHHQNIHRRAQDAVKGESLLEPGIIISPAEIALLASVGKSTVEVYSFPKTAIIATGNELVAIADIPQQHQIRRSNTYAIEAAMKVMGWAGTQFHLPDEKEILIRSLKQIQADHDVMIISGGVSKGKFDFIPQALEDIGIRKLFYQVSQRPGKPFWFGVGNGKIVFALPGNPVSTYTCFYRYIKPWILKSLMVTEHTSCAILAEDFIFKPSLTYYLQVKVKNESGKLMAYPDAGGGSGDFANLKTIDGFLELPLERSSFEAGEVFPFIPFRS